jgi:hypothetical protein
MSLTSHEDEQHLNSHQDEQHNHHMESSAISSSIQSITSRLSVLSSSKSAFQTEPGYSSLTRAADAFFATATHGEDEERFMQTQTFVTGAPLTTIIHIDAEIHSLSSLQRELSSMAKTAGEDKATVTVTTTTSASGSGLPVSAFATTAASTDSIPDYTGAASTLGPMAALLTAVIGMFAALI